MQLYPFISWTALSWPFPEPSSISHTPMLGTVTLSRSAWVKGKELEKNSWWKHQVDLIVNVLSLWLKIHVQTSVGFTNALEWGGKEKKILSAPNSDVNKTSISPHAGYPSLSSDSHLNLVIYNYFTKQPNVSQSSPLPARVSPALPTTTLVAALAHPRMRSTILCH